jgi:hypothetical protein
MKHLTAFLEGRELNLAIASAARINVQLGERRPGSRQEIWLDREVFGYRFDPVNDPIQGEPLMDSMGVACRPDGGEWVAERRTDRGCFTARGPTSLIARHRAYVRSELGDEVELPA